MNKAKAIFWAVVIGLIMLVFFQNQNFFLTKQSLGINLGFVKYRTPELASAVLFLIFFVAGLLISYFLCLPERFRYRKTIKNLNAQIDIQHNEIENIKKNLEPLTGVSSVDNPVAGDTAG